jgi:hypothetical protein
LRSRLPYRNELAKYLINSHLPLQWPTHAGQGAFCESYSQRRVSFAGSHYLVTWKALSAIGVSDTQPWSNNTVEHALPAIHVSIVVECLNEPRARPVANRPSSVPCLISQHKGYRNVRHRREGERSFPPPPATTNRSHSKGAPLGATWRIKVWAHRRNSHTTSIPQSRTLAITNPRRGAGPSSTTEPCSGWPEEGTHNGPCGEGPLSVQPADWVA